MGVAIGDDTLSTTSPTGSGAVRALFALLYALSLFAVMPAHGVPRVGIYDEKKAIGVICYTDAAVRRYLESYSQVWSHELAVWRTNIEFGDPAMCRYEKFKYFIESQGEAFILGTTAFRVVRITVTEAYNDDQGRWTPDKRSPQYTLRFVGELGTFPSIETLAPAQ